MASSSSGRYQSRLFNWLSQGFSQIEKLQPHIRRLKIGVTWGVEVVFFSAYRLSQMVWFAGRRLGQTTQQPFATEKISSSQTIQKILTEVQQLKYGQLASHSSSAGSEIDTAPISDQDVCIPSIQGIATLLETRTLVLVDEQNQVLDVLTLNQQKRLYRRIIQNLGDGPWDRIAQAAQQHLSPRSQAALGRILAWMPRRFAQPVITRLLKAQSVAPGVSRQLQESPSANSGLVVNPKSKIGQALTFLDSVSLQLERRVEQIIRLARRGLGHNQNSVPDQTSSRADEMGIRGLIRAAIAYFFNRKPLSLSRSAAIQTPILDSDNSVATSTSRSQQLSQGPSQPLMTESAKPRSDRASSVAVQQPKKTRSTRKIKPGQEQPWLTMTDLFGGSAKANLASATSGVAAVSTTAQSPRGRLATQAPANSDAVATINTDVQVISQSYSRVDNDPVDIETEAILMEYVKHPLEQVLEWLDRRLAWLEEMVIVLWSHLQPYWTALLRLIRRYWQRYF